MNRLRQYTIAAAFLLLAGLSLSPLLTRRFAKNTVPQPDPTIPSPQTSSAAPPGTGTLPAAAHPREPLVAPIEDSFTSRALPPRQAAPGSPHPEERTAAEQKSLRQALSAARREVREIPKAWAGRKENLGYALYAQNPKQNLSARFGAGEVQLRSTKRANPSAASGHSPTEWQARLRLRAFAGRDVEVNATPVKAAGSRVEYRHAAGPTEWYDNGAEAMEHGFAIPGRPGHLAPAEEVVLDMRLDGLTVAERDADGRTLVFRDGERVVLAYEKLLVLDAEGKELPSRMEPTADGFLLAYHDTGAGYPVTVDPMIVNVEDELTAFDADSVEYFGISVSISGDTLVVGAYQDEHLGMVCGSAYVFSRNGGSWSHQAKLTASDAENHDLFGRSVSISGDTVVVGADFDDDGGEYSGSAYVFTRGGGEWSQQAKLTASDAAADDQFGISVSVSGDILVVGAHANDDNGSDSGSAYVFMREGSHWSQQAKLTAADAAANDEFGQSVSVSEDTVVVAADNNDDHGANSGSAYVFTRNGGAWEQQAKLTAADATAGDRFGASASISGDTLVLGAHGDDNGGQSSGSAYVFRRSGGGWSQQAKLTAAGAYAGLFFGSSVSISGDTVVVAAPGGFAGTVHAFTRSGNVWTHAAVFMAPDSLPLDEFGATVSVSGDTVVVGAPYDDEGGLDSGSAYVFRITFPDRLRVFDHLANLVGKSGAAAPFEIQRVGATGTHVFTLVNQGEPGLDLQSISLVGADAAQFSLGLPDISANPDLARDESLDITITFQPVGGSGTRHAILEIRTNEPDPSYPVHLSGLGLSGDHDSDHDAMNDWAEYDLRDLGFDWQVWQEDLVWIYYEKAKSAGLFTLREVAGLKANASLLEVNPSTNRAKLAIKLMQSQDLLSPFAPIAADPARLSVDAQGRLVYEVDAAGERRYYLMSVEP